MESKPSTVRRRQAAHHVGSPFSAQGTGVPRQPAAPIRFYGGCLNGRFAGAPCYKNYNEKQNREAPFYELCIFGPSHIVTINGTTT